MKCDGVVKGRDRNGKKVARSCNAELSEHQIFCRNCGKPTGALQGPLSAKENLNQTWSEFKTVKSKFLTFSIFLILFPFLLMGLSIYSTRGNYYHTNIALLVFVPLALIPFSFDSDLFRNGFSIAEYLRNLKYYPHFFGFVFLNIFVFFALKVICTGFLLKTMVDPILHIVRLIMVLYWIAIIVPVPSLMIRKNIDPFSAIILTIKAGQETRWQQFFTAVFVLGLNVIGLLVVGIGLLVTLPLSYVLIEHYYLKMDEFEMFEK